MQSRQQGEKANIALAPAAAASIAVAAAASRLITEPNINTGSWITGNSQHAAEQEKKEGWPKKKNSRQHRGFCSARPRGEEPEVATGDKRAAERAHRELWGRPERRAGSGKTRPPVPGSRSGQRWPDRPGTASPSARTRTTPFCDGTRDGSADVACQRAAEA